jgi:hypothetical protein
MSRDHLKKRILKGAAYVAVVDDADVKREQILSALQVAAQDAGFRVEANGSIYGSSEISGFSVDEDMSFHDFQVVLKDAAHQIGSQFHVASKGLVHFQKMIPCAKK